MSPITNPIGPLPPFRWKLLLSEDSLKGLVPGKVGRNGVAEYAVNPPTVSLIGANVAPSGTVTVKLDVLALVTAACTAPK